MDYEARKQQMRQMRAEGMTCEEISEAVGISMPRAQQILYDRPRGVKGPKHQPVPKISIHEVLKIAEKVKEETGRYPSYGKLSAAIEAGRIEPADYLPKMGRARTDG